MKIDKMSVALVGFIQAIGVAIYCSLISLFLWTMGHNIENAPEIASGAVMLMLLVFSAAICGTLVFGYPVYLTFDKNIKKALQVLGYTFLYLLIIFILILLVMILK